MSLETEIKQLTQAIQALTAELQLHPLPTAIDVHHIEAESPRKPEQEESRQLELPLEITPEPEKVVTLDDLQSKCAQLVRAKPDNKAKIISLLSEYGVKTISSLKQNQYAAFMANLEGEF